MAKKAKLNSMRILEARGISYTAHRYDPSIRDARLVAAAAGFPFEQVFKTLVAQGQGSKRPVLALLPSNTTLNLKRLARMMHAKKVALLPHAQAERVTGLQVGGISPLALLQKNWDVYLEARSAAEDFIVISAGVRGIQLRVEREGLAALLSAKLVNIADEMPD